MKIKYRKNKLEKQLSNASEIKKAFGERAKKISARLDEIEASPNLLVLMQIPMAKCHSLTLNREGEWAVEISGNFRIIFVIDHNTIPQNEDGSINLSSVTDICIIEIKDYH